MLFTPTLATYAKTPQGGDTRDADRHPAGRQFTLLLYFFILMRLIQNAQPAADLPGALISMGIVAGLTFAITVNAGMVTKLDASNRNPFAVIKLRWIFGRVYLLARGAVMKTRMRRFVS